MHKKRQDYKSGRESESLEEFIGHIGAQPKPAFDGEEVEEKKVKGKEGRLSERMLEPR